MAQIPGVPDLNPVAQPLASPAEFGRAGAAVAQMGEIGLGIALSGLQLEAHMRKAQEKVDVTAASNQLQAADEQLQIDLKKTNNSRDVEGVINQAQDNLNHIAKQWSGSPASVKIQMYADSLLPRAQHLGQVRQIDLMGKELNTENDIQVQKLLPQLVTAVRNGDMDTVKQIRDHVSSLYDSELISAADKQAAMNAFQIQTQKQLNEAAIMSANPAERKQAIAQLAKGGSGPLDLTNLAPGDIAALRVHAETEDKRLMELAESQNLNDALNIMNSAFASPEYKDNQAAQYHALQDPEWLKGHTIVAEDGKPDYVMADRLQQQVSVQWSYREKEDADKATEFVNKISPLIDGNTITLAQVNQAVEQSGLSGKALASTRALLVHQWTTNAKTLEEFKGWARRDAELEKRNRSADALAEYRMQILAGGLPDPVHIATDPNLTRSDRAQVLSDVMISEKNDPNFATARAVINDAFPRPVRPGTSTTPATAEQLAQYGIADQQQLKKQAQVYTAWMQRINANPSENKLDALKDVAQSGVQKDIADRLNAIFTPPSGASADAPPFVQKLSRWFEPLTRVWNPVTPDTTPDNSAAPDASTPAPATGLPVGTIRAYGGSNWRFKGGDQYDQSNWEKQ